MAHTYLKLGDLVGPTNASGSTAVPPAQPSGVSLDGVFDLQYSVSGIANAASGLFSGTGATASKPVPTEMQTVLSGSPRSPDIWAAVAKGTVFPRACVIVAANATGGVATEWVRAYYLMRNVVVTTCRTVSDDGSNVMHEVGLSFTAFFSAWFANPAGGTLGARTQQGFDFVTGGNWAP